MLLLMTTTGHRAGSEARNQPDIQLWSRGRGLHTRVHTMAGNHIFRVDARQVLSGSVAEPGSVVHERDVNVRQ